MTRIGVSLHLVAPRGRQTRGALESGGAAAGRAQNPSERMKVLGSWAAWELQQSDHLGELGRKQEETSSTFYFCQSNLRLYNIFLKILNCMF